MLADCLRPDIAHPRSAHLAGRDSLSGGIRATAVYWYSVDAPSEAPDRRALLDPQFGPAQRFAYSLPEDGV